MSHRARWVAAIGWLVAYDIYAARNRTQGDTCSEVIRETFRTDTPGGRATLVGAWVALTAWLIPHLLKTKNPGRVD